jgi:hypothetical protein
MLKKRPAAERGAANHGWLDTRFTFSFAHYFDPKHMGFHALRVINDDLVMPATGFGTHGHSDMEIITYVLDGALRHEDSEGNGGVLRWGDVQRMSAGRGIRHSEFNASEEERLRLLQIWIHPARRGLDPSYEDKNFDAEEKRGRLRVIVSPDEREGSLKIHQDAIVYASILENGESVTHALAAGRVAWLQVARGALVVNGMDLEEGDGLAIERESSLAIEGRSGGAEFLLFDLPEGEEEPA